MQWLLRWLPKVLVVAALVVVLVALVSPHDDDYGTVPIPQGGVVQLPQGTTTVFADEGNAINGGDPENLFSMLILDLVPVGGGAPLQKEPGAGELSEGAFAQRSTEIGSNGAVAKFEVPEAGDYRVVGGFEEAVSGASLSFGTTAFAAVADKWMLLAGLLAGAVLISLIPAPRPSKHRDPTREQQAAGKADEVDDLAGYQPRRVNPYNG